MSEFTKDDKWLLASHLQKSIRRGWSEEALWAASHLYTVDRAYMAYRLSVMAVEDVGAGNLQLGNWIDPQAPWGAKRFGAAKKSPEDWLEWEKVIIDFASSTKDRTPCDWISCTHWLNEFEAHHGPWTEVEPLRALQQIYTPQLNWWERGLFSWRAVGTKRFPSGVLPPDVDGEWDAWLEAAPSQTHSILQGFGARQREPHPIFFPLAVYDRLNDPLTKIVDYDVGPVLKNGPWVSAALDKHTGEGKRALSAFLNAHPKERDMLRQHVGYDEDLNVVARLMFWTEGGVVNRAPTYTTATTISNDIKKNFLKTHQLSGRWLYETWYKPQQWFECRQKVVPDLPREPKI